jgi:hypothetical protein
MQELILVSQSRFGVGPLGIVRLTGTHRKKHWFEVILYKISLSGMTIESRYKSYF